jgi:hypothetical protein
MAVNAILIAAGAMLIGVAASMVQHHLRRNRKRRLRDEQHGEAVKGRGTRE